MKIFLLFNTSLCNIINSFMKVQKQDLVLFLSPKEYAGGVHVPDL